MPPVVPAVAASAPPRRQRIASRQGLPVAVILSWGAILGLVLLAGLLVWRERAKRVAEAQAPPAAPVAPIVAVQPKPKLKPPASVPKSETKPPPGPPTTLPQPAPHDPSAPPAAKSKKPAQPKPSAKQPPVPAKAPPQVAPSRDVWQLPPLVASSPELLDTLAGDSSESFELSFRSNATDLPAKAAIFAEAAGSGTWTVWYVSDIDAPVGKVALATIHRDGQQLMFAWSQPFADAEIRRQVANCQVELREGAITRFIQLREKAAQTRLALDLSDDRQTLEFPLPDLPKSASLRLDIRDLAGFPGGTSIRGDVKSLPIGKFAVIEFAELPGAEIELRFMRPAATGNLMLRVEPVFKEKKIREFEMSLDNLKKHEESVTRSLGEAKKDLSEAQVKRNDAQIQKVAVAAWPNNSVADKARRQPALKNAQDVLDRQEKRIQSLNQQIQLFNARLAAVPKLRSFLLSIHRRASVSFQVVAECGDHDLVLVDATQPL